MIQRHVKEIDPSLVVRSKKFLGSGSFQNCYLAYYRHVVVADKEYKKGKRYLNYTKREVHHKAKMINQLDDHCGVPLLFSIVTKSKPFCLITKFHRMKQKSYTLHAFMKKKKLDKPTLLIILKIWSTLLTTSTHAESCITT